VTKAGEPNRVLRPRPCCESVSHHPSCLMHVDCSRTRMHVSNGPRCETHTGADVCVAANGHGVSCLFLTIFFLSNPYLSVMHWVLFVTTSRAPLVLSTHPRHDSVPSSPVCPPCTLYAHGRHTRERSAKDRNNRFAAHTSPDWDAYWCRQYHACVH
jgi:hypothetical protein